MAKKRWKFPKWLQILLSVLVSGGILLYVSTLVDWDSFLLAAQDLRWRTVILLPLVFLASILVQAVKYWFFMPEVPLWAMIRAYVATNFFFNMPMGAVTGPAFLIVSLKDYADPVKIGSTLLIDMFSKLIAMLCLFAPAVLLSDYGPPLWVSVAISAALLACSLLFSLLLIPKSNNFLRRKIKKLSAGRWKEKAWMQKLVEAVNQLCNAGSLFYEQKRNIFLHLVLGMLAEALMAVPYMIIAREISIDIAWQNWLWIHCIVRVFCMIPFTVGGLGAREGALLIVAHWIGIASGSIMTLSLLYSVSNILSLTLLALVFFWMTPKSHAKKARAS